ncbi:hypothetical protein ACFQE8_24385 [Salinirubellus sp. GCM10025818]|uniref:hypothetical protein n=1 Tax=Salinirubellus TaxID=2162630 RepID=UPI0030CDBBF1
MAIYDRLADLPLVVEGHDRRRHERSPRPDFTRVTTELRLQGLGATGAGEDVTYETEDHDAFAAADDRGAFEDAFVGEWTFGEFSDHLDDVDLWPEAPSRETSRDYRRWGVESAALDLALRQAGETLGGVLDREYDPVRFVVSSRVESIDRIETLLGVDPDAEFKLDPEPDWDDALFADLADTGRVRVADLKGFYEGTVVDTPADPEFYRRTVEAFPDAVIEDARWTEETTPILEPEADRLAWDAPIHSVEDVEALPVEPRWLNVKPSRFGTVESLFECIEYCLDRGVSLYGGGQYELGPGRSHLQVLASLFYPDTPNDVAPSDYNESDPPKDLPRSPLDIENPTGLGWG